MAFRFWLGVHKTTFLERTTVPLFVSHRQLIQRVRLPRAIGEWALDSGGFTEISTFGEWRTPPSFYVSSVRRYMAEVGGMKWAAIQDWMCEPVMLEKTGKTVEQHQDLTVRSYLTLREMAPEVPWAPVLQGWTVDDYCRCVEKYEDAGVRLALAPIVGVGTMCRRQGTDEAVGILRKLKSFGLSLHGFGFKILGLQKAVDFLASSDSLAWSLAARRREILLPGHTGHKCCNNCLEWALLWRQEVLDSIEGPRQASFPFASEEEAA